MARRFGFASWLLLFALLGGCASMPLHTNLIPQGKCPPVESGLFVDTSEAYFYAGQWISADRLLILGYAGKSVLALLDFRRADAAWTVDFSAGTVRAADEESLKRVNSWYSARRHRVDQSVGEMVKEGFKEALTFDEDWTSFVMRLPGRGETEVKIALGKVMMDAKGILVRVDGKRVGPVLVMGEPAAEKAFSYTYISPDLRYFLIDNVIVDSSKGQARDAMMPLFTMGCRGLFRVVPTENFDQVALLFHRPGGGLTVQRSVFNPGTGWYPPKN